MTQRDAAYDHDGPRAVTGAEIVLRAADQRKRADREQTARDRLQASADREAFAKALAIAETDALTGVHTRAAGLTNLDRELDRCGRSNGQLVVTYCGHCCAR